MWMCGCVDEYVVARARTRVGVGVRVCVYLERGAVHHARGALLTLRDLYVSLSLSLSRSIYLSIYRGRGAVHHAAAPC